MSVSENVIIVVTEMNRIFRWRFNKDANAVEYYLPKLHQSSGLSKLT